MGRLKWRIRDTSPISYQDLNPPSQFQESWRKATVLASPHPHLQLSTGEEEEKEQDSHALGSEETVRWGPFPPGHYSLVGERDIKQRKGNIANTGMCYEENRV